MEIFKLLLAIWVGVGVFGCTIVFLAFNALMDSIAATIPFVMLFWFGGFFIWMARIGAKALDEDLKNIEKLLEND